MHAMVLNKKWKTAILAIAVLLTAGLAGAQQTVNLTAQRSTTTLPDGKVVPMWGFFPTGSAITGWAVGPTITATPGSSLTINLTNNLPAPTSIVILGQIGGGLGQPVKVDSPVHAPQTMTTWPANAPSTFTPPTQGQRARSFAPEAGANGGTATYTWSSLNAGTYLYETGTQPSIQAPMGLYGVLVVTNAPTTSPAAAGQAYPGAFSGGTLANIPYDADATLLLSEIDAAQNAAVDALATPLCPTPAACSGVIDSNAYPPAVNYAPTYFLINGKSFDKTAPISVTTPTAVATSGNVLVRLANAGLHTHVPSIVNLGLSLIAEDGNVAPGLPKVQSEVLLPAGKTFDVLVKPSQSTAGTFDAKSYRLFDRALTLSGGNKPDAGIQAYLNIAGATLPASVAPTAVPDSYQVGYNSPFSDNVLANDIGISNAGLVANVAHGTLVLNTDGTFTYTPATGFNGADTFTYNGNSGSSNTTTVTLNVAGLGNAPNSNGDSYTSSVATFFKSPRPGVLQNDTDPSGYALKAEADPANALPAGVTLNEDGSFTATGGVTSFTYIAVNAQGTKSAPATVTINYLAANGPKVSVIDALSKAPLSDYRWIIEEDTTYHNSLAFNSGTNVANTLALNFHKSYMPVVAQGCTGPNSCGTGQTLMGAPATCDGLGVCTTSASQQPQTTPDQVHLDPAKYYFISVLPGDAANPFIAGFTGDPADPANAGCLQPNPPGSATTTDCGHTMGGASIAPAQANVTVLVEPNPLKTAQISVYVFEDNNPTNGDIDDPEPGLGGFQIIINDVAGKTGDPIGQTDYDAFNMPLTNSLLGTPGCPYPTTANANGSTAIGMVLTCPSGSPLAGQALIKNLMPGRYDVIANPGAEREGAGEQWFQVSTLEGGRGQDGFAKSGEPEYFQEFGPPSFHAWIGFINPAHIAAVNASMSGNNTIKGQVVNLHMSRPIAEDMYPGSHDYLSASTSYVSLNSQSGSGANVAFAQCDDQGNFTLTGVAPGDYQIVIWDQWLDQIISYYYVNVPAEAQNTTITMPQPLDVFNWFTHVQTSQFVDADGTHKPSPNNPGIAQVPVTIRFRDGAISNILSTDADGNAEFTELFPLFNWYVIESDVTRYKGTKTHIVVDGGGKPDASGPYKGLLTSHYPTGESSERFDDGKILYEGLQGFIGQTEILEYGKTPFAAGENGGIMGMVVYANTRPFDDPTLIFQNLWAPAIPRVTVNLYQEKTAPDGSTSLVMVNTTTTSSWDDNLPTNCPGQLGAGTPPTGDPFVNYTMGAANIKKCYDGFHNWNQVQPAQYDGRYMFNTLADGTPLPPGKYVVEVVPPAGYELVKEEDKNILIGDQWVAPATQQFGALSNIFILPDQATIGQYNNNPNNPNNATTDMGHPGTNMQFPPCVGTVRVVPDYISLFPQSGQVAPFAGASRPLCDRKEVTLGDQSRGNADFFLFTSAHIAAHFTGMILDDAASEINSASPDFGEKFAVPNVPVSIKDFNGIEIERVYADQWGTFNGLAPSSWQVNVPNPAGYSPNMLITCMNDPGPIPDPTDPTGKRMITDPNYNPMFSDFCYTNPFMPGLTDYLDTPVLPVAAFAAGYQPVDCSYPDATPAIARVDSSIGFGPYLPTAGGTLTIKALGDAAVPNPDYAGPAASSAPYNQKTILRHYGFGATVGSLKIGNTLIPVTAGNWTDSSITVTVPKNTASGQLSITSASGKSSIDAITVTIEDRAPVRVAASAGQTIQSAIDATTTKPGDLILIDAGTYNELVILYKPLRLQGVGAASVIINAAKYPSTKLADWRPRINTLFGIDAAGNQTLPAIVDPLPGQEITGGVVLLEPSVLSTEEGAGITVLAKGLRRDGVTPLTGSRQDCNASASNFLCNPSRIDGVSVTGGDAGGGIYVNGWAHNLEISNNRVYGNAGGFNGGIRVGVPYLEALTLTGRQRTLGFDTNVKIHNNSVSTNGTVEPNAGAAGAGGGISMCSGSDNYSITQNWICGNYAATDGGGIGHLGLSPGGTISHNSILFNQSYIQGANANGGGIVIAGEPPLAGGLTLGTGDVTIDANLIQGNFSQSGHGGGVRLQQVNGSEVSRGTLYAVTVTNNMIVNNVAGWSGGGISLADAVNSSIVNNTIANNDSTGIVGALFTVGPTTSTPSAAGVSSETTSAQLINALRFARSPLPAARRVISNPVLNNNIIWHNRSFFFDMSTGVANLCPSNTVSDAAAHKCVPLTAQTSVGQCDTLHTKYWDLGIVGDASSAPGVNHLNPTFSILTSSTGYVAANNQTADPTMQNPYCNGSRANPGLHFEPGTPFLPTFQMSANATLDEAGNFVDLRYGPISITGNWDYRVNAGSPAIDKGSSNAPNHDFFGNPRPQGAAVDIGATEWHAPTITSPAPGTVLPGSTATFTWTGDAGMSGYYLWVGTTGVGSHDILNFGITTATSLNVSGLPTNGKTVYVRLQWVMNGIVYSSDYTYTASSSGTPTTPVAAQIVTPANGSVIKDGSATFTWNAGTAVTGYQLWVGTTLGSRNLYSSPITTNLSAVVSGLPTDGTRVYARLYSVVGSKTLSNDYSYTTGLTTPINLAITSPVPGSVLSGPSATFQWNTVTGASGYYLWVGTGGYGSHDILNFGITSATAVTVAGLPTNGSTVYVRLSVQLKGVIRNVDYTYTASNSGATSPTPVKAQILSPAPGSLLSGGKATFTWTPGTGVSGYGIWVGATPGARDYYSSAFSTALGASVTGLPKNGSTVYVRLYSVIGNTQQFVDYTYTTGP